MRKQYRKIKLWTGRWADRIHIPGYKNVTLFNLSAFYFDAMRHGQPGVRAAGISFRFLTALFPLSMFLFSIIPFIPIEGLQDSLMLGIRNFFPDQIYVFFHQVITDLLVQKHSVLLSVGFVLSIYFASSAVDALITGLNSSYHVYKQGRQRLWRQKLTSVIVLLMIFVLFILSFVITAGSQWLIDYLYNHNIIKSSYGLLVAFKMILSFFIFMFVISVIYNVAHTDKTHWRFFNVGAITSTILIYLLKETFGLYITYFGKFDKVYGHLGAALAFLVFIYYLFLVLILGFELNTSLQKAYFKKNYNYEEGSAEYESIRQQARAALNKKTRK